MSDVKHVTTLIYYVGDTTEQASEGFPFDEWESAEWYRKDNGYAHVYGVTATMLLSDFLVIP